MRETDRNRYVLAVYDIRGKQDYIYRSSKIKEIVGASLIIRDCFQDYLYPAAIAYRDGKTWAEVSVQKNALPAIYNYKEHAGEAGTDFDRNAFEAHMQGGQYLGEVIYDGGGNFYLLYKDEEVCRQINRIFCTAVEENTGSLKVDCVFTDELNFDDYPGDQKKLRRVQQKNGRNAAPMTSSSVLPFSQIDRTTSMPLYKRQLVRRGRTPVYEKMSRESYCKYAKYWSIADREREDFGEAVLDNLITEKGKESLLAVIYVDGNNMGAKVADCLKGRETYEDCIKELRRLSEEIQRDYIDERKVSLDQYLDRLHSGESHRRRFVVNAGDEITFLCNARNAYELARTYLESLPKGCSSCAGIAVFHSHAPYADAYRIAEECCESGKSLMKKEKMQEACLLDVHYCQSGIGTDLDTIREHEVGSLISKPWFVSLPDVLPEGRDSGDYMTTEKVEAMAAQLRLAARTNVKGLAEHAKRSLRDLKIELKRIEAHSDKTFDFHLKGLLGGDGLDDETMRRLIYDVVIFYDLWFSGKTSDTDDGGISEA